ncbi:MAG: MFS transporter [Nevskiales bacterium]
MLSHLLAPALARRSIHYGWVMVAVTFVAMLSTAAAMGMPGVLMVPLRDEFGWDTGAISGPLALRLLLFGLVAPFAAALMQRYGLRTVVGAALAMIVVGLGLASQMTALWQLWLTWGVLIGLATGITAMVLAATVSNRWFAARRGLVMGLLSASNATGQLIFLPVAAWLADHLGWRMAMFPAGVACALCLVLVLLLARDHPGELGLPSFGERIVHPPPQRAAAGNAARLTLAILAQGAGNRTFWILLFTFFVCGLSTNGIVQNHFIPLCHDYGLSDVQGASVLAMMGAFDFVGTILSGWLSDRYDNRWLLFWYYGLRGLSLLFLPYTDFTLYGLSLFAVFYGLDWVATVPPTVKLAAQAFGQERAPLIFGWVFTAHQLGAATAALGAGVSRDALASYLPAFMAAGAACLLAALAAASVRRPRPGIVLAAE